MQEEFSYALYLNRRLENLLAMVNLSVERDNPSSSEPLERRLTREEKQQLNSGSQSLLALKPDWSTELVPDPEWVLTEVNDLALEDFEIIDKARKSAWYVLTPEEFADDILAGKYDIWRISGIPGCHCIIMTNFDNMPRNRFINVHFMAGKTVVRHKRQLLEALGRLMDKWECSGAIFTAANEAYGKRLGGRRLTTLYMFEREDLDGQPEGSHEHYQE